MGDGRVSGKTAGKAAGVTFTRGLHHAAPEWQGTERVPEEAKKAKAKPT